MFFGSKIKEWILRLDNYLDRELKKTDKKAYLLRFSDSWWHRFIWRHFFKKNNILSFSPIKSRKLARVGSMARKVIHVTNLVDPNEVKCSNLKSRFNLALHSIEKSSRSNTFLLGCSRELAKIKGWKTHKLSRTAASSFGEGKEFAFLKDMFDAAAEVAGSDDLLFYSNLDCPISPRLYENLLSNNEDVTEFFRRDIDLPSSYADIFNMPYSLYEIGIDGLSIRKSVYLEIRDKLPDCVIGEPHWDTAYSGILNQHYEVYQNASDLYHPKHDQQWDDSSLSLAGNHNKRLYLDSVNYGLMSDELISLKKQTAIIVLDSSLNKDNDSHLHDLIPQVAYFAKKFEVVFSEFVSDGSRPAKMVNSIKYLPIFNTNSHTACLNQENSIINCILHQFSSFKNIIIFKSSIPDININLIKELQLALQNHGFYSNKHIIATKNNNILENELDIYGKNDNIKDVQHISYINDDGLLELLNNYDPEHIQSKVLPV